MIKDNEVYKDMQFYGDVSLLDNENVTMIGCIISGDVEVPENRSNCLYFCVITGGYRGPEDALRYSTVAGGKK